jgi:hypothetical protein
MWQVNMDKEQCAAQYERGQSALNGIGLVTNEIAFEIALQIWLSQGTAPVCLHSLEPPGEDICYRHF